MLTAHDIGPIISIEQSDHPPQHCDADCYLHGTKNTTCLCKNKNRNKGLPTALLNNEKRLNAFTREALHYIQHDPFFTATIHLPAGYLTIAAVSERHVIPSRPPDK